jgi:hypothetical protein
MSRAFDNVVIGSAGIVGLDARVADVLMSKAPDNPARISPRTTAAPFGELLR